MSEVRLVQPPAQPAMRRALRAALARRGRPLRVIAEDLTGLSGALDLVAADPAGRVVVVLVAHEAEQTLELVARALAERATLGAHLADWCKLAPDLGLRPEAEVDALLVAPEFSPAARAAAASQGDAVALARLRFVAVGDEGPRALLEALEPAEGEACPTPRLSLFRSGLQEADLQPTADAR